MKYGKAAKIFGWLFSTDKYLNQECATVHFKSYSCETFEIGTF